MAEKRYVFLEQNRLAARWGQSRHFVVAETGFGTGLNFLLTWALWRRTGPSRGFLHYLAVERYPLARVDLARAHGRWPDLESLAKELRRFWPPAEPGFRGLSLDEGRVCLGLLFGDVGAVLPQLRAQVDVWFLDGFAPARNPAMWSQAVFTQVARLTKPDGMFSTYTASGNVRRGLAEAGFQVEKRPGFGAKREMLRGRLTRPPHVLDPAPWFAIPPFDGGGLSRIGRDADPGESGPRRVAVIGAGLAGTAVARSLAKRGWLVTLVERHEAPAREASGNPAGVVMPLLAAQRSPEQRWFAAGYRYTLQCLERFGVQVGWSKCGVLAAAWDERSRRRFALLMDKLNPPLDTLRSVDADEASSLCGMPVTWGGLYLPEGGSVSPAAFCRGQLEAPGMGAIEVISDCQVTRMDYRSGEWVLLDRTQREVIRAPAAILAGGKDALGFEQVRDLPLRPVRGQITHLAATSSSRRLRTVVCGPGYVVPAADGRHCIGATYDPRSVEPEATEADDARNLETMGCFFPALWEALAGVSVSGRASFRAVTPDLLPMVGPVPQQRVAREIYRDLRRGRSPDCYPPVPCYPGLYVSAGHGSRGLVSAPLAGELLAAMLAGEPLPVEQDLCHALHPARFMIRQLKKPLTKA